MNPDEFPTAVLYRFVRVPLYHVDDMTELLNSHVEGNERVMQFAVVGDQVLVLIEREEVMGPWVSE